MIINRPKKKLWLVTLLSVSIIAASTLLILIVLHKNKHQQDKDPATPKSIQETEQEKPSLKVNFSAMGDMLAHDSVVNQVKLENGYDFTSYFEKIKPIYAESDIVFCNPETPSAGEAFGISGYPTFNAPKEFARDLSKSGCNLINLASNHIADKGQVAINQTKDIWEELKPLAVNGANRSDNEQRKVSYFEINGLRFAFLAFADFSNAPVPHKYSVNFYHDKNLIKELLTKARESADVVIISAHWGTEDSSAVNQDQIMNAQLFADLGADVIIGTGPHVLQKVSWLKRPDGQKTLVWYSIGNMLSSQLKIDELTGGIAKFQIAKIDNNIEISDISFTPTFMSYQWSDTDRAAERLDLRTDLKLQLLKDAKKETAHFGVSIEERYNKIRSWLGQEVELKIH